MDACLSTLQKHISKAAVPPANDAPLVLKRSTGRYHSQDERLDLHLIASKKASVDLLILSYIMVACTGRSN